MAEPFVNADDLDHPACGICPSKRLPRSGFVVYDRPTRECPFNPADGFRYATDGMPACVHPHKLGLEPDRIAPPPIPVDTGAADPAPPKRPWWRRLAGSKPSSRAQ
ncbi:hypothetical protein FNX44_000045 [Streptomyces sp. OF1]|uniref:Uncharacterized protein n=1 Tax=Streptomyces alkaliterrae TaxID=2213162 RepID=A0A5P0YLJ4_9ACTN|nr:hypothetical protein [Streptomyces alkaliterrae]